MFPSLAIFSGAGSTLDMQAVEPLKLESQLLKPLTQNKIIMCLLLDRRCPMLHITLISCKLIYFHRSIHP